MHIGFLTSILNVKIAGKPVSTCQWTSDAAVNNLRCGKACVSPPKFHYAKNSDEPLSGRFSQQRLRESSRVSSPWRRGYFSGLTQAFPHRRVLTAASEVHWQVETGFPAIFTFKIEVKNPNMHFQFDTLLSTTIYLWLISLTASKELSILLLKLLECR